MPSSAWSSDVCRSEEHTSELQSLTNLVCRLLLEKKKIKQIQNTGGENSNEGQQTSVEEIFESLKNRVESDVKRYKKYYGFDFFFFNDTATTEIYTLSLHDALPILFIRLCVQAHTLEGEYEIARNGHERRSEEHTSELRHDQISYAVFCLKKCT